MALTAHVGATVVLPLTATPWPQRATLPAAYTIGPVPR